MYRKLQFTMSWWLVLLPVFGVSLAQNPMLEELAKLDSRVLLEPPAEMLADHARKRMFQANQRSSREWYGITGLEQWKDFAQVRLEALRDSLGDFPAASDPPQVHLARTLSGDGFRIENLVFESRPHLWVTANLYVPDPIRSLMPGVILSHSQSQSHSPSPTVNRELTC